MTRKTSSSSNNASQPKAPACDFFMKDPSLMPSLDLHPVDEKRWLDFVPAQHGAAQGDKRPNRWETIMTMRQQLQAQMMSHHAVDYMGLLHEYGVDSAGVKVEILDDSASELYDGLLIDEPIGGTKESNNDTEYDTDEDEPEDDDGRCKLTVHPIIGVSFDYWSITGGGPEICHPMQDTTMVYLYLPFWEQRRELEFSMQDRIIWFDGSMVMAMAEIHAIHQDNIIMVNNGLIVPVSASFWPRAMPPIDLDKSYPFDEDNRTLAEYGKILLNKPRCPEQSKQLKLLHRTSDDWSLPRLANGLGISLGNQICEEVEEVMKSRPGEW